MNRTFRGLARAVVLVCCTGAAAIGADLRIGLIGIDTSHSVEFAKVLNNPANPEHVAGAKITAAWKGGSVDVEASANRVDGYTDQMVKTYGVKIYDTIEDVARNSDAVILMSVDGRTHLNEARRVFPFHKPVFVDKPMGGSLQDVIEIFRLAREYGVPCFASSSLRYTEDIVALQKAQIGRLHGVIAYGPGPVEPHIPDLFFYGIHSVEKCYALMGTGCMTVVRTHTANTDSVTGVWSNGSVATIRTFETLFNTSVVRPVLPDGTKRSSSHDFGMIEFGSEAIAEAPPSPHAGYAPLLQHMVKFFQTGVSPVPHQETVEVYAFMEAADESKRKGGVPVRVADVIEANGGLDGI